MARQESGSEIAQDIANPDAQRPAPPGDAGAATTRAIGSLHPVAPREPAAPATAPDPLQIRVVHGGLDYARFPLLVGHHLHEGLSATGRRVNAKLGGQLQCVIDLKLFVGALRSAQYLRPNNHCAAPPAYAGAVVLGLGAIGELTPGNLAETVTRGVLRYAFEHVHRDAFAAPAGTPCELRLSSVLPGTQLRALMVGDAVAALMQGVWRAAQLIANISSPARPVRLVELEIVEIDESTALDIAYEVRRLLDRAEWQRRYQWPSGVIETREGGTSGYRRHVGSSTWQRLIVRHDAEGGLAFALIGSQARVEATQVRSDVASLRRFIDRISDDGATDRGTDPALGSVLFQLLLPHALQSRMTNLDNTVLVVDDASAAYPWELLTPPAELVRDEAMPRPIAVRAGFVRQRVTTDFRQLPRIHSGFRALLVGAPDTSGWIDERGQPLGFNDLPGARAEAAAVAELLRKDRRGWNVEPLVGPAPGHGLTAHDPGLVSFERVRVALLKAPCRVLHLCGHGVVDQWIRHGSGESGARAQRKTGMVLSNQELLGAVDVESMSSTPEFVFINCCYSGRDGAGLATGSGQRAALAASLALKFIDMGSRAVIATGWQIDDEAALAFARRFYVAMLQGQPFGEAVRQARHYVHANHDGSNTWGAFQCYGDPAWRLEDPADAGASAESEREVACLREAATTVSPGELAACLAQVQAIAGDTQAALVTRTLDQLIDTLRADKERSGWLHDSRVVTEVGLAYRELGEHEKAATWLQRSARSIGSQMRIGDIDTLVDSLVRVRAAPGATPAASRAAQVLLTQLDQLGSSDEGRWPLAPHQQGDGPTCLSERESLRGALALRTAAALLEQPGTGAPVDSALAQCLQQATRAYAAAYRIKLAEHDTADRSAHALAGALLSAALLALLGEKTDEAGARAAAEALQTPGQAAAGPGDAQATGEWLRAARDLLEALARGGEQRATFAQHAKGVELRTAHGLFAHAMRDDGYDRCQVAADMNIVRGEIGRLLHLWPSPLQLEGMQFRFRLMQLLVARLQSDDPGTLEVGALAHEALRLLHLDRRAIG